MLSKTCNNAYFVDQSNPNYMKTFIIIAAALFLFSCTKSNQMQSQDRTRNQGKSLHAVLLITSQTIDWVLTPDSSVGQIAKWNVRMCRADGSFDVWGQKIWQPGIMSFATDDPTYNKAVLTIVDSVGNSDSTVINQQF